MEGWVALRSPILRGFHCSGADHFGGGASRDRCWGDVGEDGASCGDEGAGADGDARGHEDICGDPGFGADGDWFGEDVEGGDKGVVAAGADVGFLRDDGVGADGDFAQAVEDDVVADPGMIADGHLPGEGESGGGADDDALADFGAEAAEEPAAPGVEHLR